MSLLLKPVHDSFRQQTILNTIKRLGPVPDSTRERLSYFEDLIIDCFVNLVIGDRYPSLQQYLDGVLQSYPQLRFQIKNRLGQLGIKALAGVPVVMAKQVPSETLQRALPGVVTFLMHHLLEVVSDKIEGKVLSERFNIPASFAADFAKFAYDLLGGASIDDIAPNVSAFFDEIAIREPDLAAIASKYRPVLGAAMQSVKHDETLTIIAQQPIQYLLLLNLIVIEHARQQTENHLVISEQNRLVNDGESTLYQFMIQGLAGRYFSCAVTEDPGYARMDLKHAIETRADSILTDYTMAAMLNALSHVDASLQDYVDENLDALERLIRRATTLIGLANDCGHRLLRMEPRDIRRQIGKLAALEPNPRTTVSGAIVQLHEQAMHGVLPSEMGALFPIIKDIAKGERNLVLDCRLSDEAQSDWDHVAMNTILVAEQFQEHEAHYKVELQQVKRADIYALIDNFVQYNFQIYAMGSDYDHEVPVVGDLDIMNKRD